MATYATYRHIELDNVGCGKKRVLKPPGGGTSDIFNGSSVPPAETPRRVKNLQPSSKLFAEPDTPDGKLNGTNGLHSSGGSSESGSNNHPGNGKTHWRLFGPPPAPVSNSPSVRPSHQRLFGEGPTPAATANDGNPVTGEGYEENGKNGSVSSRSSEAGSVGSLESGGGGGAVANGGGSNSVRMSRGRVPPGGFSSGFW